MKLNKILIMGVIGLLGSFLGACSGGRKGAGEERPETLRVDSVAEEVAPAAEVEDAVITGSGIGLIRTGMRIVEIHPQVENLYDTIIRQTGYDSNSYYFFLDGEQRFTVYEFDPGTVSVVSADAENVVANTEKGETLRLGDDFRKVLALPGVKSVWQTGDEEGLWSWTWGGLWFLPDQSEMTEAFSQKYYNQSAAPGPKDLGGEKIGYIGTGLPF